MKLLAKLLLVTLCIVNPSISSENKTPAKSEIDIEKHYFNQCFKNTLEKCSYKIGILVINLGLHGNEAEIIEHLPSSVSLAFTCYFDLPSKLIAKVKSRKHELYITIPAPNGRGPGEISASVMNEDNFKRWFSNIGKDYQGFVFEQPIDGHPFYLDPLVKFLTTKKPTMVLNGLGIRSDILNICQKSAFKCAVGDKIINASDTKFIRSKKLSETLKIVKLTGKAILLINIKSSEVARELAQWLAQIKKDTVDVVPISKLTLNTHQKKQ